MGLDGSRPTRTTRGTRIIQAIAWLLVRLPLACPLYSPCIPRVIEWLAVGHRCLGSAGESQGCHGGAGGSIRRHISFASDSVRHTNHNDCRDRSGRVSAALRVEPAVTRRPAHGPVLANCPHTVLRNHGLAA